MRPKLFFIMMIVLASFLFCGHLSHSSVAPPETFQPILTAYVIDVGMGDAIFLDIPPEDCMLIDAGSWDPSGVDNLMTFLDDFFTDPDREAYKSTLDLVVATHQHKDHIQGMLDVLKKYKAKAYVDNGVGCTVAKKKATKLTKDIEKLLSSKGVKHIQVSEEMIKDQGTKGLYTNKTLDPFSQIDVYAVAATPDPVESKENNNSIVLKVVCKDVSFLFMGDAEEKEESRLLSRLQQLDNVGTIDAEVLKAGHHGSNTSSSEDLLKSATPKISIVSVGVASESPRTKSYRLPKESTVERLIDITSNEEDQPWQVEVFPDKPPKNAKLEKPKMLTDQRKEVYFTSSDGTIAIMTDGKTIKAESYVVPND